MKPSLPRLLHRLSAAALILLAALSLPAHASPNFILILSDDQSWVDVAAGMDGVKRPPVTAAIKTPVLDRMAAEGMRFSRGYAPAPLCSPTRRSLVVGMTTARTRGSEFESDFSIPGHLTIPAMLKQADADYRCAHFGKWGEEMGCKPEEAGYDESDGATINKTGNSVDRRKIPQTQIVENDDPKLAFSLSERASDFMKRQVEAHRPFFVQVSHYATHYGVEARPDTVAKFREKGEQAISTGHAAMLFDLDAAVGEVIRQVEALGIADETWIIYASDNGAQEYNRPLREGKQSLYEGGIRVPFIVMGPGVPAGRICHEPVALYDLLPTFADLADFKGELPSNLDGVSFRSHLVDPEAPPLVRPIGGLIFHRPNPQWGRPASVIMDGDFKLYLSHHPEQEAFLYKLAGTPAENRDLSAEMPRKAEELKKRLLDYLDQVDAEEYDPERARAAEEMRRRHAERRKKQKGGP